MAKVIKTTFKVILTISILFVIIGLGFVISNLTKQPFNIGTIEGVNPIAFSLDSNLVQGECEKEGYQYCYQIENENEGAVANSRISSSFLGVEDDLFKFKYLCEGDSATMSLRDEDDAWTICGEAGCPGFPLDLKGEVSYTREELSLYSSDGKNVYLYFDCFDSDLDLDKWNKYEDVWITEVDEFGNEVKGYWDKQKVAIIEEQHKSWVWASYRIDVNLETQETIIVEEVEEPTIIDDKEPMPVTPKEENEVNIFQKIIIWFKSLFGGEE